MSILSPVARPLFGGPHSLRRFSVAEYHLMIQTGILREEDEVELLDGYVVLKTPKNAPHEGTLDLINGLLPGLLPAGTFLRLQQSVTLSRSETEPDFAVVRGNRRSFLQQHPGPAEIALVIEVSDSSLDFDRNEKATIYARDAISVYWIVNLVDMQVEVRTAPQVIAGQPAYTQHQDYAPGDDIPLVLDGVTVATIPVRELLP